MSGTYSRYLVCGKRRYRDHDPGDIFEAILDPEAEKRAIERGNIRVLARVELEPENLELPDDWPPGEVDAAATGGGESRLSH